MNLLSKLKGEVVVSVQAAYDEPLYKEECMKAMMLSVVNGGAKILRVAGERDVKIAKSLDGLLAIGITKPKILPENWIDSIYITPTVDDVRILAEAGADIIAFDATLRTREKDSLEDIVNAVKSYSRLAMADIATFEEALNAKKLGVDLISTTLSGYTLESKTDSDKPDFELLEKIVKNIDCPVILEGRIWNTDDVKKAFDIGAHSVVIGSAITRPQLITKRFLNWR